MKKLKGNYLKFRCTPSKWISKEPNYHKITQLLLSYGGGMGGTNQTMYVERINLKDISSNKQMIFTQLNGEEILINTAYIVSAKQYTIVSAKYETTNEYFDPIQTIEKLILDKNIGKIKLISK